MEVKFMALIKPLLINSDPLKEENCWLQKEIFFRKIKKAFSSLETRESMKTLDLQLCIHFSWENTTGSVIKSLLRTKELLVTSKPIRWQEIMSSLYFKKLLTNNTWTPFWADLSLKPGLDLTLTKKTLTQIFLLNSTLLDSGSGILLSTRLTNWWTITGT